MNFYKVLELEVNCTPEEIKTAFRRIVKEIHPDNFINKPEEAANASHNLTVLKEAYNVLRDPNLRRIHDFELFGKSSIITPGQVSQNEIDANSFVALFALITTSLTAVLGYLSYSTILLTNETDLPFIYWAALLLVATPILIPIFFRKPRGVIVEYPKNTRIHREKTTHFKKAS